MTLFRTSVLLLSFAALAMAVVYLRGEQSRSAGRTLRIESQWFELRREWWNVQAGVARLRAPQRIKHCVDFFDTDLVPPGYHEVEKRSSLLAGRMTSRH